MNIDHLKAIPLRTFSAWFSELAKLAERSDDNSGLPKLELSLRSGHVVRGCILGIQENAHDQMLMVWCFPDPYTKSEISFVPAGEVIAFTILEPETSLKQLMAPGDQKAVGALELKRAARNVEAELEKVLQFRIALQLNVDAFPGQARWDVLRTIGLLPGVLSSVAVDDLGRKLVRERISAISILVTGSNSSRLDKNMLILSIATPLAIPVASEKERLKKEIEDLL